MIMTLNYEPLIIILIMKCYNEEKFLRESN